LCDILISDGVNNAVQIKEEMAGCLDFLKCIYSVFGFSFQLQLSTRPEKFLGEVEDWDLAEKVFSCFFFNMTVKHTHVHLMSKHSLISFTVHMS